MKGDIHHRLAVFTIKLKCFYRSKFRKVCSDDRIQFQPELNMAQIRGLGISESKNCTHMSHLFIQLMF